MTFCPFDEGFADLIAPVPFPCTFPATQRIALYTILFKLVLGQNPVLCDLKEKYNHSLLESFLIFIYLIMGIKPLQYILMVYDPCVFCVCKSYSY